VGSNSAGRMDACLLGVLCVVFVLCVVCCVFVVCVVCCVLCVVRYRSPPLVDPSSSGVHVLLSVTCDGSIPPPGVS